MVKAVAYTRADDDRELPPQRLEGELTTHWVAPLQYLQHLIDGVPVDASTVVVDNAFCPTGPGGGVDPSCPTGGGQATVSLKAAKAKLEKMDTVLDLGEEVFTPINEYDGKEPAESAIEKLLAKGEYTATEVAVDQLFSSQPDVNKDIVASYLPNPEKVSKDIGDVPWADRPIVVPVSKGYYVHDGNHRIVASMLRGYKTVKVYSVRMGKKVSNAFCPTGPGGGVDPSCSPHGAGGEGGAPAHSQYNLQSAAGLGSYLKAEHGSKFTDLQIKKMMAMNPKGVPSSAGGKFYVFYAGSKALTEEVAKKVSALLPLPDGTKIIGKHVGEKELADKGINIPGSPSAPSVGQPYPQVKDKPSAAPAPQAKDKPPQVEAAPVQSPAVTMGPKLPDPATVKVLKDLPGSTNPKLVEDENGKKWVMKSGAGKADQLRNESYADAAYRALGVPTPHSGIVETSTGPVKFSEYMENTQTLKQWEAGHTPSEKKAMYEQIGEHMAADALLSNWDVIGLSKDNILVKDGVAYRVDNGGSLKYRAQGTPKGDKFSHSVSELVSLKNAALNPSAASVFKYVSDESLKQQSKEIASKGVALLAAVGDPKTREILAKRLEDLKQFAKSPVQKPFDPLEGLVPPEPEPTAPVPLVSAPVSGVSHGQTIKSTLSPKKTPQEVIDKWLKEMSPDETEAIRTWKKSAKSIKKAIAGGRPTPKSKDFLSAITKAPVYQGTVYRGIHGTYSDSQQAAISAAGVGGTYSVKSPCCMSRSPMIGHSFSHGGTLFVIETKTGRQIEDAVSHQYEKEITSMPGVQYKILAIHHDATISYSSGTGKFSSKYQSSGKVKMIVHLEEI